MQPIKLTSAQLDHALGLDRPRKRKVARKIKPWCANNAHLRGEPCGSCAEPKQTPTKTRRTMNAHDFEALVYDGAVYCESCLPDDASDEDTSPIFANSEWDFYPTCDKCHYEHDYVNLTSDGLIWRREREWSTKMKAFAQDYRDHKLSLPSFTPFGLYTLIYVEKDGSEVCGKCANDTEKTLPIVDYGTYDEGPTIQCAECNDDIESSY